MVLQNCSFKFQPSVAILQHADNTSHSYSTTNPILLPPPKLEVATFDQFPDIVDYSHLSPVTGPLLASQPTGCASRLHTTAIQRFRDLPPRCRGFLYRQHTSHFLRPTLCLIFLTSLLLLLSSPLQCRGSPLLPEPRPLRRRSYATRYLLNHCLAYSFTFHYFSDRRGSLLSRELGLSQRPIAWSFLFCC